MLDVDQLFSGARPTRPYAGLICARATLTEHSYTPLPGDDGSQPDSPRTVTVHIAGILVSKRFTHRSTDANGNTVVVSERAHSQSAAYGDPANLRTTAVSHPEDAPEPNAGRVIHTTSPDGRRTTHTHELGAHNPADRSFTPGAGTDLRSTSTEGTAASPDGIAYKTTRSVSVADQYGRSLYSAEQVHDGATYHTISWSANTHDNLGRLVRVDRSDGSWTVTGYDCCGQAYVQSSDGSRTETYYDSLGRADLTVDKGAPGHLTHPPQPDIDTHTTFDPGGRVLATTTSAGGLSLVHSNTHDSLGRLLTSTDPAGLTTTHSHNTPARVETTTNPDGGTTVSTRYLDGRHKQTTGTATVHSFTDRGVNADGTRWTKRFTGPALGNSPRWTKTTTDFLGRSWKTERPALGPAGPTTVTTTHHHDSAGRLWKTSDTTARADTIVEFDALGNTTASGLDLDGDGTLGPADRYSTSDSAYATDGTDWFRLSWTAVNTGSVNLVTTSVHQVRLTGLSLALASETVSIDIHGNETLTTTAVQTNGLRTVTTDSPFSTNDAVRTSYNGLLMESTGPSGITHTFKHDALRRRTGTVDPRAGESIVHYDSAGRVAYTEDAAGHRTTYGYDAAGRRSSTTNALTNAVHTHYSLRGEVLAEYGPGTYPVRHAYDGYGQRTGMWTYRTTNDYATYAELLAAPGDSTTWHHDPATGLLTNKLDAAGHGPAYTYHDHGGIHTRTWARSDTNGNPMVTTYTYTNGTLDLAARLYSDDLTPDVHFTHTIDGRKKTVIDAAGWREFDYNAAMQEVRETIHHTNAPTNLAISVLERAYDALGRPTAISLPSNSYEVTYTYHPDGRFKSVDYQIGTNIGSAVYTWHPQADLLVRMDHHLPGGPAHGNPVATAAYQYEPHRDHKTVVSNSYNSTVYGYNHISSYQYTYDPVGRRTHRYDSGTAVGPGVVTNDFGYNRRNELIHALMGSNLSTYAYDNIGNRRTATQFDGTHQYTANSLNQYTKIVTDGAITNTPQHDLDGNQLTINGFAAVWNGENRLTTLTKTQAGITNAVRFAYDHQGRRVRKTTATDGTVTKDLQFVYDNWNLALQHDADQGATTHTWGLDLSLSKQGAGGIGGLLGVHTAQSPRHPTYDANGNIAAYIDRTGGLPATYKYDGFGNVAPDGLEAADVVHQFSTKYFDDIFEGYYYGYRQYLPRNSVWLSRDPLEELGGINLNQFSHNSPLSTWDYLGLACCCDEQPHLCSFEIRRVRYGNDPILNWTKPQSDGGYNMSSYHYSQATRPRFDLVEGAYIYRVQPGTVVVTLKHSGGKKTGGCTIFQDVTIWEQSWNHNFGGAAPDNTHNDARDGTHDYGEGETRIDPNGNAFIQDSPLRKAYNLMFFDFEARVYLKHEDKQDDPFAFWGYWSRWALDPAKPPRWGFWRYDRNMAPGQFRTPVSPSALYDPYSNYRNGGIACGPWPCIGPR